MYFNMLRLILRVPIIKTIHNKTQTMGLDNVVYHFTIPSKPKVIWEYKNRYIQ